LFGLRRFLIVTVSIRILLLQSLYFAHNFLANPRLFTLQISTYAITSNTPGDAVYNRLENLITATTIVRDVLASQIKQIVEGAEFGNQPVNELQATGLIVEGDVLLQLSNACVANLARCAK
jgi:hypothetical protein